MATATLLRENDTFALDLSKNCERIETDFFNILGYIPVVSTVSGSARALYAKTMVITSLFLYATTWIQSLVNGETPEHISDRAIYQKFIVHGVANLIRAMVEIIPIFHLLTIPYDLSGKRFSYIH